MPIRQTVCDDNMGKINIVLLGASCMLLWAAVARAEDNYAFQPISEDSYKLVNDYLVSKFSDGRVDFAKTITVQASSLCYDEIKKWVESDEFSKVEDEDAKRLAQLIAELDVKNICAPDKIRAMSNIVRMAGKVAPYVRQNVNSFWGSGKQLALSKLLRVQNVDMINDCFKPLDTEFTVASNDMFIKEYGFYFSSFGDQLLRMAPKIDYLGKVDVQMMYGAWRLEAGPVVTDDFAMFVYDRLSEVNHIWTERPWLAGDGKTGDEVPLSIELAREYLQDYFIGPCERLLSEDNTKSHLLPLINIMASWDWASRDRNNDRHSPAVTWGARVVACQTIVAKDREQLVKALTAKYNRSLLAKAVDVFSYLFPQ